MISHQDIEALFADLLDRISDTTLRGRVVDCWVDGCARGGWESVDQLTARPLSQVELDIYRRGGLLRS